MNIYNFIAQQIMSGSDSYEDLKNAIWENFQKELTKENLHTIISRMNNSKSVRAKLSGDMMQIKYKRKENRYVFEGEGTLPTRELDENEINAIAVARNFLKTVEGQGGIFKEFNQAINNVLRKFEGEKGIQVQELDFIEFEKMPQLEGNRYLGDFVKYIKQRQLVKIKYKEFFDKEAVEYFVLPVGLKVYDFRWYVIGLSVSNKDNEHIINWDNGTYKPFGLYYLESNPVPIDMPHYPPTHGEMINQIDNLYGNVTGITLKWDNPEGYRAYNKTECIVLRFRKPQEQYALSTRLGKHMKPLKENDPKFARYELNVIPTYELMMRLLAWNYLVEILQPEYLRKDFQFILEKNLKLYKT